MSSPKPMRIAFVWDWEPSFEQTITWEDGLARAIKELINRGHEVTVYTDTEYRVPHPFFTIWPIHNTQSAGFAPDVILHWADMTRPHAKPLSELGIPMAICFAGGDALGENSLLFDHIFVESQVYKDRLNHAGYDNISIAFGTNTDLFQPIEQNKTFDTIFPATFAIWKRHHLYAKATEGLRSLAVGYIYKDHETECWKDCLRSGVTILPHVSAQALVYLYAASKVCVVPSRSDGGSQRTVLEAMAMNLPLVVCDSDKFDYARDFASVAEPNIESLKDAIALNLDASVTSRDFILNNWSHIQYADALEEGLSKLVSR